MKGEVVGEAAESKADPPGLPTVKYRKAGEASIFKRNSLGVAIMWAGMSRAIDWLVGSFEFLWLAPGYGHLALGFGSRPERRSGRLLHSS